MLDTCFPPAHHEHLLHCRPENLWQKRRIVVLDGAGSSKAPQCAILYKGRQSCSTANVLTIRLERHGIKTGQNVPEALEAQGLGAGTALGARS